MELNWMLVSESSCEADGALMADLVAKHRIIACIGDGEVCVEIWPSEPPEHPNDFVTLTRTVDSAVIEELGRFETYADAKAAAKGRFADHDGQLPA